MTDVSTYSPALRVFSGDTSAQQTSDSRIRVIYVMGAGRSGSTALEAMLGDHEDVVAVGELSNIYSAGWSDYFRCSCGELSVQCPLWRDIRARFCELTGLSSFKDHWAAHSHYENFRPRTLGIPQWARLTMAEKLGGPEVREWQSRNYAVYQAIADVTGKRIIVDSTKSPIRARALCMIPELDVRLVHLVRDVRGVTWSRQKAYRKNPALGLNRDQQQPVPVWRSVAYWSVMNALSSMVRSRYEDCPSLLVRYEDYTRQPLAEFARISDVVGIDYGPIAERLVAGQPVRPQHTSAGNPVRMLGAIKLSPDFEWMQKLPAADRKTCWRWAGLMMQAYGYVKDPQVDATVMSPRVQSVWDQIRAEQPTLADSECKAA